jgi:hypothetical protein
LNHVLPRERREDLGRRLVYRPRRRKGTTQSGCDKGDDAVIYYLAGNSVVWLGEEEDQSNTIIEYLV